MISKFLMPVMLSPFALKIEPVMQRYGFLLRPRIGSTWKIRRDNFGTRELI